MFIKTDIDTDLLSTPTPDRNLKFLPDASAHMWSWLALSGIVGFTIGDLCLFRAFVVIGARISMLLMALVPPVAAIFGWLIMGKVIGGLEWLGMGLAIAGVSWVILERSPATDRAATQIPKSGILLGCVGARGSDLV